MEKREMSERFVSKKGRGNFSHWGEREHPAGRKPRGGVARAEKKTEGNNYGGVGGGGGVNPANALGVTARQKQRIQAFQLRLKRLRLQPGEDSNLKKTREQRGMKGWGRFLLLTKKKKN